MHPLIRVAFETKSITPAIWRIEAHRLRRAANILFDAYLVSANRIYKDAPAPEVSDLDMIVPASLLYGASLENLLKARIIDQAKPTSPDNLKPLFGGGSGHSLVDLAARAGVVLLGEERELADRLSLFVEWAGRYPAPKRLEKMTVRQTGAAIVEKATDPVSGRALEVKHPYVPLPLQEHEQALFDRLFERIESAS